MKIVFMGTPDFAVPSLEILLKHNYTVLAVVTAPDKPRGRGQEVSYTAIKESAIKHSLPILQPEILKDPQFISQISNLKPDLLVVVAFRILPKEVYTLPSKGAFNLHASLLPKYRGAAPINWAIINGEKESGVTSFFLQDKVDTGNIILQARVAVTDDMNAGELHDVLSEVGAEIVLQTVRLIELDIAKTSPQNNLFVSPAPKIFKEDCRIQWNQSSEKIYNFIRGLSPYPSAWTTLDGKTVKIYKCSLFTGEDSGFTVHGSDVGVISIVENKRILAKVLDDYVEILELQQEGRKRMTVEEFLHGFRFAENTRFE